jgi:hypothetical protein
MQAFDAQCLNDSRGHFSSGENFGDLLSSPLTQSALKNPCDPHECLLIGVLADG